MADEIIVETTSTEVIEVGVVGPQGPKGDKGDPGDIAGEIAWDNITGKPSTFAPSSHTHTANQVTDFNSAAAAAAPVQSVNGNTGAVTVSVPSASSATPQALGVAAAGTSTDFARADHVHAMPSAADVGAAPATGIDPTAISGTAVVDNDARLSDSRTPSSHASSHASAGSDPLFDQDLNTTDAVTFTQLNLISGDADGALVVYEEGEGTIFDFVADGVAGMSVLPSEVQFRVPIAFPDSEDQATTRTNLGLGAAATADIGTGSTEVAAGDHGHGNLSSDGKLGSTAGLPVVTTTAGAVTTLALGTAGQVLRTKSDLSGVEFADPAASGVTGAAASASDVLGVSGSDITGVDATADRIVFWDDSASALKYLEAGSGLSISGTTLTATASGAASQTDVFTANGTWTKPAGAKSIHYVLVGGGGGGGSGRRGAASTDRYSGGGGGGAAIVYGIMDAANAGSTETVTVGAGGTGGASPADSTNGNAGTAGGESSFGTIVKAIGGNAGGGGTNSAGGAGGTSAGAGTSIYSGVANVATGAAGGQINGANAAQQASFFQPTGGGSGSGISSGNSRGTGGAGGLLGSSNVGQTAGGTGGSNGDGGNGNNSLYWAGTGGGGGQANNTVSPIRGQKGGTGGIGAGGGGGSGATNADGGDNAGGNGGNGVVVITTYF